jgi:hypothetical protein
MFFCDYREEHFPVTLHETMETILSQRQQMAVTHSREGSYRPSSVTTTGSANLEEAAHVDSALQNLFFAIRELQQHFLSYSDDDDEEKQDDEFSIMLPNGHTDATLSTAMAVASTNPNDDFGDRDDTIGSTVTIEELMSICSNIQASTYLQPIQLVRAIVDASSLPNEAQQQAALFDIFGGETDEAMDVLIKVGSKLSEIQQNIHPTDINQYVARTKADNNYNNYHYYDSQETPNYNEEPLTYVDIEEERRQLLLQEAMDAAQVAAIAQAQVDNGGSGSSGTHSVVRTSDKQALKFAEKAKKRAAVALQRAKDAGVMLVESDLLNVNIQEHSLGTGGLINRSEEEIWTLQQSLLPEGTREYYDHRGLPKDAIREKVGSDMERVIIPAKLRDATTLPQRLKISNIMDPVLGQAFEGTESLNPMQSTTFPIAFHARDNMMICAPVRFIMMFATF